MNPDFFYNYLPPSHYTTIATTLTIYQKAFDVGITKKVRPWHLNQLQVNVLKVR